MRGELKKKIPSWLPVTAAMVIPGSGHVLLGLPFRGLQILFFIGFFGFITYKLSGPDISIVGRFAGGLMVWVLSVVEIYSIKKKKSIRK